MSNPLKDIEAQAMKLSPQERADLADHLWMSVNAGEPDADWDAEIERRVADDDAGRTQFMPAQEAMDRLGEHIRRRLAERR